MSRQVNGYQTPSNEITITINKPALKRAVRRAARIAFGATLGISILALIGTAGALDCSIINIGQAIIRSLIFILLSLGAVIGLMAVDNLGG